MKLEDKSKSCILLKTLLQADLSLSFLSFSTFLSLSLLLGEEFQSEADLLVLCIDQSVFVLVSPRLTWPRGIHAAC